MKAGSTRFHGALKAGIAVSTLAISASAAFAGGFAVREQSASLMGSAFAGAAAGVDLSSGFWNPAAFGIAEDGFSTQSAYTLITADTELSNMTAPPIPNGATATDIDKTGYLSSSYAAYRLSDQLVLGASVTAPFGLATDNDNYLNVGRTHGVAAEMFTVAVNAALSYEVVKGVHLAAGPTFEFMKLKYWVIDPAVAGLGFTPTTSLKLQDDMGVGFTAGILVDVGTTKLGVGFRSKINHEMDGRIYSSPLPEGTRISADLETPEMVTASLVQALSNNLRVLGTVEWTNWSRVDVVNIPFYIGGFTGFVGALDAKWDDGWFFSGGLEYDYSPVLTVRAGGAYEISPIRDPSQRLSVLPDSDRIWATVGATYKYSESTTFDLSYAHIFFKDSHLTRDTLKGLGAPILNADVENSADIFSVGMRTRW